VYVKAQEILTNLPFLTNLSSKLTTLTQTILAINDEAKSISGEDLYHPLHFIFPVLLCSLTNHFFLFLFHNCRGTEDLLSIFCYVLCRTNIPAVHSELALLKFFLPAHFIPSIEAFSVATLEAALLNLQRTKVNLQPSRIAQLPAARPTPPPPATAPAPAPASAPPVAATPIPAMNKDRKKELESEFASLALRRSLNQITYEPPSPVLPPASASAATTTPATQFNTLKKVEKQYILSLKSMVDSADAHNQLAAYYHGKGKLDKAMFHTMEALKIEPSNPISLRNRHASAKKSVM
jgi:hypothetical protein